MRKRDSLESLRSKQVKIGLVIATRPRRSVPRGKGMLAGKRKLLSLAGQCSIAFHPQAYDISRRMQQLDAGDRI